MSEDVPHIDLLYGGSTKKEEEVIKYLDKEFLSTFYDAKDLETFDLENYKKHFNLGDKSTNPVL